MTIRAPHDIFQRRTTNDLPRMIALLEGYISNLHRLDMASQQSSARNRTSSYYMPSDLVTPEEWTGFDNVYQVHSPHIIMDNAIRDVRRHTHDISLTMTNICPDHDAVLLLLAFSERF